METRRDRTIAIKLPPDEFDSLAEQARQQDRTAWQQARHLIRRGLGLVEPEPERDTSDAA